ncbi:hypothetical protein Poly51_16830 [Rubripirellula tenax]|uniref:Uncharacterized protein n=1 Tax=Rubripirellula tenax TaxID=2528015 RepID=A0A5C6FAS6_9BACT|nr:hypothetical protein Poly51_16830 [Rubripirellula tenax]
MPRVTRTRDKKDIVESYAMTGVEKYKFGYYCVLRRPRRNIRAPLQVGPHHVGWSPRCNITKGKIPESWPSLNPMLYA